MQRDWDFVRELLTDIEGEVDTFKKHNNTELEEKYVQHVRMLEQAGFIKGLIAKKAIGGQWTFTQNDPHLTWDGHDLLNTLRSQTVWEKIKERSKETGIDLTTDSIKALGAWALKALIGTG